VTVPSWPEVPSPPDWPPHPGWPYPPDRPTPMRQGPVLVPVVDFPGGGAPPPRRVVVSGPLDTATVVRVSAELMELDGRSADDVELVVNSDGGSLGDLLGLLDVIASMRARVATVCMGRATGSAAVLVACGTGGRRAGVHATMSLRTRIVEHVEGPPDAIRARLDDLDHVRRNVVAALARATGRPASELDRDLDTGPMLDRAQAIESGLLDP
jgi:ATP-dependent Clp protease, protease subunit